MKNIMGIKMRRMMKADGFRALLLGALTLLLAGATLLFLYCRLPQEATFPSAHLHERKVAVEMGRFRRIRQPFLPLREGLSGVSLKLQVSEGSMGKLKSRLRFTLLDEHGSPVEDQIIPASALVNYGTYTVSFPALAHSAARRYTIRLMPEAPVPGEEIVAYVSEGNGTLDWGDAPAGAELTVDGIYRTTRIGSLYNGRLAPGRVTLMIRLSGLAVLLLSALTVWLFGLWFFPGRQDSGRELPAHHPERTG